MTRHTGDEPSQPTPGMHSPGDVDLRRDASRVNVELRQLQAVLAVAEERSFTAAGRRLHLSQQSVSALIRRVEVKLGVSLFQRTTRSVEPTAVCERMLPPLSAAMQMIGDALREASTRSDQERPLRLGVPTAAGLGPLKDLLEAFGQLGVADPEVRELWADELVDGLLADRFDAVIGIEVPPTPEVVVRPWRRQRVDLLVSANHAFASLPRVTGAQLAQTILVLPKRTTRDGLQDTILSTLTRAGTAPAIAYARGMSRTLPAVVERGEAVTVWLSGMDDRYVPQGFVHLPLHEPETFVTIDVVTPAAPRVPQPAALEALRKSVDQTSEL